MPPLSLPGILPVKPSHFNLNTAGVAGFFGGEEAISAMHTVHLYKGRRWLGWFNSPGSYTIAKRFGTMANSRFWDGLFPGPNDSPAVSFGLDGKNGPQYIAALSGTTMPTGHLAYLTMERSKVLNSGEEVKHIGWRETTPCRVAYLAMKKVDYSTPVERLPLGAASGCLAIFAIVTSIVACIMCALIYDWFSFFMISFGIISSGFASLIIGDGRLAIKFVNPASGAPPGHGILIGEGRVVVIKGEERDVNAITKGRFILETGSIRGRMISWLKLLVNWQNGKRTDSGRDDDTRENERSSEGTRLVPDEGKEGETERKKSADPECRYHAIGVCSLGLLVQFLVQLLFIPQATLFGQIMFLVSFGASWAHNSYLSSLEKEKVQTKILFRKLEDPEMRRFCAGTRTTMAVFACLLLFHGVDPPESPEEREDCSCRLRILRECIPNDTPVWNLWRKKVVDQFLKVDNGTSELTCLERKEGDPVFSASNDNLFGDLLKDARAAFEGYFNVRDDPKVSKGLTQAAAI